MAAQSSHPFSAEAKQQAATKTTGSPHHDNPSLPELRLVLLGRKGTGKSSSGNTILGITGGFESGKPTEECVKRRTDIASHRVTVVDTPGWEWYYSSNGTPAWVTRETMRSVTVCPPGPHALLLVMRSFASVTEDYYRQVEEHLELLGKTAWAHTMLLFTHGEELGSIPIKQRIQNAGKSFQKLLQRCGNRFHVLENKRCGKDGAQVKELISKIDELVKERGGRHYESDPLLLGIDVEGKRRARERRKKQRIMETQTQKGIIKAVLTADISPPDDLDEMNLFSRGSRRLPELRIILLGERETGKSSAGNTILGGSAFFQTGQATEECSRQQAEISGRLVTVIDVPGWEGGPEGFTPDRVQREICASVTLCPPGPHALLLTLRVDALVRATAVREHLELLGEGVWRHTILLFTRGDQLREGVTIEQHIQGGGKDLRWLLEKCGNRYHVISSVLEGASSKTFVTALLEKIEKMVSGNRCEAFSPVVQEIQELGKQKNERFNVKLKEVNEKLQRQELELKRMREREVKSLRRIFDWRKDKFKSPEKAIREREEGMDRTEDDRKSITSELEERMAWLTEDREREIQELSLENNRVIAALNQGYSERGKLIVKLEETERENEELKEKVDELQVNILELKRVNMLKEQEKKEREEELTNKYETVENELIVQLDHKEKEGEELRRRAEEMEKMMAELKLRYEEDIFNEKQEQKKRLAEKVELEKRLEEKQKEMEGIQLKTENNIREHEERMRESNEKRETEKNKLSGMIEMIRRETEELQVAFREQAKSSEADRQIHESTVLKCNELVDKLVGKDAELFAIQQRHNQQEIAKNIEIETKLKEKDSEITALVKKHMEKEQEIETLKQTIDDNHRIMENVKNDSKVKTSEYTSRIKDLENEYKEMEEFLKRENVIMKEEIDVIKNLNEENTRKRENDTRKILDEKENIINHLQQQNAESRSHIEDLKMQLKEVQVKVENLNIQNAALIEELDRLHITCEDYKRDLQTQIVKYESREKEIKDLLNQSEEMGKIKDTLYHENITKKEEEICLLNQRNHTQQRELEILNERGKDLEKKTEEMKKYCEQRLSERIAQMDVKDAEREQRLHKRELELCEREHILEKHMQELERSKKDLDIRTDDIKRIEQEVRDEKQLLDRRQNEVRYKENELKDQSQNNQHVQENLEIREKELKERERQLESKYKEQRDLSEKQNVEIESIKKQLEEKENRLKKIEEELAVKQTDFQEHLQELECQRENLDIRDKEFSKREQQILESEQLCEARIQEVSKSMQEVEQNKRDIEKWQAELTTQECSLMQRSSEFQKKEQEILQQEHDLQIKIQHQLETNKEIEAREQELLNKQEIQAATSNQLKNELETIKDTLALKEQELRNTEDILDKRDKEFKDREKDLEMKENQIGKKYEDYEAAEKVLESKQKAQRDLAEKQGKENENIRQQLEAKERELVSMQADLLEKQIHLQKEKKDFESLRENLENRESEFEKIKQGLVNSEQLCELKAQELSKEAQELEKSKQDHEKWQAELSNKEYDLLQRMTELHKKEQELVQREHDLQLKSQELLGKNEEVQQQLSGNQQNQVNENWESQLEGFRETLANREQELTKKMEEFCKREQHIRSSEIYLDKREIIVQKGEREVQILKEQNNSMLSDLKKQQEKIDEIKCSLETKQHELHDLEKELSNREQKITNKEQDLNNQYKELDMKEHKMEKCALDLKSRDQAFKKTEQELNELNLTLESKKKYLEKHTAELENQKSEMNIEKQMLKMKSEQLEKWGKYLYNMELKMINSNPSPDFQPWNQRSATNLSQTRNSETMYQDVGIDNRTYDIENGNISAVEDDQSVEMAASSETTNNELENEENEEIVCLVNVKTALQVMTEEYKNEEDRQEVDTLTKEEDVEEFFEPGVFDGQVTQDLFYQLSELKLMLIGEAWSSRQSATRTILGQDAEIGNPWRGNISGKPLLVVEPHGIKWRCSKEINMTFQKDLSHSISLCTPGPHAFILLLPAYLTFTGQYRRAVECTMAMLGEAAWRHTVVLFTWAEALGESGHQHIKRNGDLEWLIQKCGGRYHVLDNRHREAHLVELLEMVYEMVAANHGRYYQVC